MLSLAPIACPTVHVCAYASRARVCVFVLCVCLHLQVYVRMAALFSILRGGPHHKKHVAARDA